jgi:hypothetical protein
VFLKLGCLSSPFVFDRQFSAISASLSPVTENKKLEVDLTGMKS